MESTSGTLPIARWVMGGIYVVAGTLHFIWTPVYEHIMPAYLPAHHELVLLSGFFEIAGGLGVLLPDGVAGTRRAAAWGLVCLLVAVSPANLWMAQHPELTPGVPSWLLWLRVPLQLPLIAWAWLYTRRDR